MCDKWFKKTTQKKFVPCLYHSQAIYIFSENNLYVNCIGSWKFKLKFWIKFWYIKQSSQKHVLRFLGEFEEIFTNFFNHIFLTIIILRKSKMLPWNFLLIVLKRVKCFFVMIASCKRLIMFASLKADHVKKS